MLGSNCQCSRAGLRRTYVRKSMMLWKGPKCVLCTTLRQCLRLEPRGSKSMNPADFEAVNDSPRVPSKEP